MAKALSGEGGEAWVVKCRKGEEGGERDKATTGSWSRWGYKARTPTSPCPL